MLGGGGSKFIVDRQRREIEHVLGDHRGPQQRQVRFFADFQHSPGRHVVTGDDEARHLSFSHLPKNLFLSFRSERTEVSHLSGPQNLDTFVGEILEEPSQRQSRAVDRALFDQTVHPVFAIDGLELQLIFVASEEMVDGDAVDGLVHGSGIERGRDRERYYLNRKFALNVINKYK